MSNIDILVEQYEQQAAQWEVSVYDVAQTQVYKEWAAKNIKGLSTEVIENLLDDPTNIHIAFVRPPRDILDKALHSLGLDLEDGVERQLCPHKTFSGVVVQGERYVGTQRTDKEWKNLIKNL